MKYHSIFKVILSFMLVSCTEQSSMSNTGVVSADTIVAAPQAESNTDEPHSFLLGYWKAVSYYFGDITALDTAQTEALMKKQVYLGNDIAIMFGDTLYNPTYTIEKQDAALWAYYGRVSKKEIGIKTDSIWNIEVSFRMNTGNESYREFGFDGEKLLICSNGPYIWLERDNQVEKFNGSGSMVKEYLLKGKERELHLSYEFFSDPDELIIYDQLGKALYNSGMQSTKQPVSISIPLTGVEKLVFKINTKSSKSQWRYEFSFK